MDNTQMNAQEIIDFIRCAEKKTPVKLYVREKPGQRIDWKGAHVFGGRKGKIIFGDWGELSGILQDNADSIDYYEVENDGRNLPCPCSTPRASTRASSPARSFAIASPSATTPSS